MILNDLTLALIHIKESFRDAIGVLEEEGKLRCLCVHGVYDLVPMIPVSAMTTRFCQSGVDLVLGDDEFEMRYSPKPDDNYMKRVGVALGSVHKIGERHHYLTEPLRELISTITTIRYTILNCLSRQKRNLRR